MLEFKILTRKTAETVMKYIFELAPLTDEEYLSEIVESLLSDDGCEYALSASDGCLAVRVFDGRYSFIYPVALNDGADADETVEKIRAYAVKEEIPLVFTDVPCDELGRLITHFRHANVDAADPDGENFTVCVLTEAQAVDCIPTLGEGEIVLDALTSTDDGEYAGLCKDRETNRFWGYDYSADVSDPADSYFRECAEGELARGVAMSFAVRRQGKFLGEATLYAFDLHGGCDCAIRILPEYRRGGVASAALSALMDYGREIGLIKMRAVVMSDNLPSVRLFKKHFDKVVEKNDKTIEFTKIL